MDSAHSESVSHSRCGDVPRAVLREAEAEAVEADDHEGDVRGRGLHSEAAKVRALHPSDRSALQEGARHAPRAEDHVLPGHHRREEEPAEQAVLGAGSDNEGHDHRGECERTGLGHGVRKGRLGQVCAGDKQS